MKSLIVIFSAVLLQVVFGNPVENVQISSLDATHSEIGEKELNYLIRYGYLDEHGTRSQAEIKEAIEAFQKFVSLPITGIIDEATIKMMQAPRCGHPDIIKNKPKYTIVRPWSKKHLSYYVHNVSRHLGDVNKVAGIIQFALDKWAPWGELTFTREYDMNADIIAFFVAKNHEDTYAFDGKGGILAHAFFPGAGIGGDIHYDDDEEWAYPNEGAEESTDLYSVSIHELGHSLGLAHSNVQTAIMFPFYKQVTMDQPLDYDDVRGMYELYMKNPSN